MGSYTSKQHSLALVFHNAEVPVRQPPRDSLQAYVDVASKELSIFGRDHHHDVVGKTDYLCFADSI